MSFEITDREPINIDFSKTTKNLEWAPVIAEEIED